MYYLQSRYYDPTVGRFINEDASELLQIRNGNDFQNNLFAYCSNDCINDVDPFGYASYRYSYYRKYRGVGKKVVYDVTIFMYFVFTSIKYTFNVEDGVILFYFNKNNYWGSWWRGGVRALAHAIYTAVKKINSGYLSGRSYNGIHAELFIHWSAYTAGIKRDRANPANIGGKNKKSIGYDSNAWVFETANVIRSAITFTVLPVCFIRDMSRYL